MFDCDRINKSFRQKRIAVIKKKISEIYLKKKYIFGQ